MLSRLTFELNEQDEVQLLDVTGAGMINRLLSWYWRLGGVVIATSNRLPQGKAKS
jgi:predicted ATPase